MKYFITDIHGEYHGLELLLEYANINFTLDQLVFGGDYINRGTESASTLKKIKALVEKYPNNVFAVIGNHEEMMRDYYRYGDKMWLSHGGHETLRDFERTFTQSEMKEHIEWASNLPLVYQDEQFVFTHAGLNPFEPLDHQSRDIIWMNESDFYGYSTDVLKALTQNRPVIHGHTPVERIYFDGIRLNCDLGSNTYSIVEERGLGLVNLTEMTYLMYKPALKKIEKRKILSY